MASRTVIIVGAGMVGAACAFRLQTAGFVVTLVDPGPDDRAASFGNAGHIAVEQVEPLASWGTVRNAPSMLFGAGGPLDFRLADAAAWMPWAARYIRACRPRTFARGRGVLHRLMAPAVLAWRHLLDAAGAAEMLIEDGHAVLWSNDKEARSGQSKWMRTDTGNCTLEPLSVRDLEAYGRVLLHRPPVAGLRVRGTARLTSPQAVRTALLSAFQANGGQRLCGEVIGLSADGEVELADGTRLSSNRVLISAGVRSTALMRMVGAVVPLIAERGYSVQFSAPAWPQSLPTAVLDGQSIVLAPQSEGLRATSYVEFARPDSPPDPRKWDRLVARLRAAGLDVPDNHQRWMGSRPTLPDYVPAIGAVPNSSILYAFGHQHLGVTLSAITAERVLALTDGLGIEDGLNIDRFST